MCVCVCVCVCVRMCMSVCVCVCVCVCTAHNVIMSAILLKTIMLYHNVHSYFLSFAYMATKGTSDLLLQL